eukprot:TRINITY_DN89486_c0_g1_i1.p1 TRINITY_DN89486_c0_g1~~TRINITY_DN89486_c0_g1_i1.p1  ORF type:complete len:380 (-),score=54.52 TRINITY_DN89486_c0_g1_i1:62-1201(-)
MAVASSLGIWQFRSLELRPGGSFAHTPRYARSHLFERCADCVPSGRAVTVAGALCAITASSLRRASVRKNGGNKDRTSSRVTLAVAQASRLMPTLPSGLRCIIKEQQNVEPGMGSGSMVWPCAGSHAKWQITVADHIRGSSVLELGGGCGPCGLFAALLGAAEVLLTDGNEKCCELMESNVEANRQYFRDGTKVQVQRVLFEDTDVPQPSSFKGFDWIFGTDILTDINQVQDTHEPLSLMIKRLLQQPAGSANSSGPRCILAHGHRRSDQVKDGKQAAEWSWDTDDEILQHFIETAHKQGLTVKPIVTEVPRSPAGHQLQYIKLDMMYENCSTCKNRVPKGNTIYACPVGDYFMCKACMGAQFLETSSVFEVALAGEAA